MTYARGRGMTGGEWVQTELARMGRPVDLAAADQIAAIIGRSAAAGGPGFDAIMAVIIESDRAVEDFESHLAAFNSILEADQTDAIRALHAFGDQLGDGGH